MFRKREKVRQPPRQPSWSRRKIQVLLVGAAVVVLTAVVGLVVGLPQVVGDGADRAGDASPEARISGGSPVSGEPLPADPQQAKDQIAAESMLSVPAQAAEPGAASTQSAAVISLPGAAEIGPADVPTGFPQTPEGALAQQAAIVQAAMQSGSVVGAQHVIEQWAQPGGPTAVSWSVVTGMATLVTQLDEAGGPALVPLTLEPRMGLIKGTVGDDWVVPCVDFVLTLHLPGEQPIRAAIADCQRMQWDEPSQRWMIAPGPEPATPPSVWPGTDLAIAAGYSVLEWDH